MDFENKTKIQIKIKIRNEKKYLLKFKHLFYLAVEWCGIVGVNAFFTLMILVENLRIGSERDISRKYNLSI